MRFFVGGYAAGMDGHATGIGVLHAGDPDAVLAGGSLSRHTDAVSFAGSASWLAWHPTLDVVYAALEDAGTVQAFRRTGTESFVAAGMPIVVGETVCHVAVEPGGSWLIASCYGDGQVVRVHLDAGGLPVRAVAGSPLTAAHAAAGMDAGADLRSLLSALRGTDEEDRSEPAADDEPAPRAHHARFLPHGVVVTTDLGRDTLRFWRAAGDGLREIDRVTLPPGTAPRHTVWHPSGHLYVVTEQSLEIFVVAPPVGGDRGWRIVGGTLLGPAAEVGRDHAAEIALTADATFVSVGVRGADALATLRVRGEGENLAAVALVEAGVGWPRHHVVARDTLLVAGQRSDSVASLALDLRTGIPGRVRHRVDVASPAMLLPDRR